jgi:hypothetical protein
MPIKTFLSDAAFGPDQIDQMSAALETSLRELRVTDRTDPLVEIVAKRVIELAVDSEPDASDIARQVIAEFGEPPDTLST